MRHVLLLVSLVFAAQVQADDNVVLKQAKQVGINHCITAVEKISNFLADGPHGAHTVWHNQTPDDSAFTSAIERTYSDGSMLSTVTVARTNTGACYTEYEKVFYMPKGCIGVAQGLEGAEYKGELNANVVRLDHDGVNVYLMPAGNGCVVTRKEIIMDAR